MLVCFLACATAYAFFQVPYVVDARRDDLVVRRAHPADDLAGGDPRVHDHARRRDRSGDPGRGRWPGRLPRDGDRDGARHRGRRAVAPTAAPDTPRSARSRPDRARCATSCGSSPSARDFRLLLVTFVVQALATGCMLAGVDYLATDVLDRKGATTMLFVCFVGPALLLTPAWAAIGARIGKKQGYLASSVVLAAGALLAVLARSAPFGLVVGAVVLVGVGYAGCQVFPLAMLPDAAAVDARRTGSSTGRRLHRRLDRRRDARPRARARALRAGAGHRRLPVEHRRRRRPAGLRTDRDHARLLAAAGRPDRAQPGLAGALHASAPTRSTRAVEPVA